MTKGVLPPHPNADILRLFVALPSPDHYTPNHAFGAAYTGKTWLGAQLLLVLESQVLRVSRSSKFKLRVRGCRAPKAECSKPFPSTQTGLHDGGQS